MSRLFLIVLLLASFQLSIAQIRATTESGNKVLLFDDGTWQYEEKVVAKVEKKAFKDGVVVATPVKVNATKDTSTELKELFYLASPRMQKYFGEKGNIRCKLSCSNTLGAVQIRFMWEIPVDDGTRYFGSFKAGTKVTIHMVDGQKLDLLIGEENDIEYNDKYNYTTIYGTSEPLTNEQVAMLNAQPFRKIEVDWRKKPESYDVELSRYFMETLPIIL